MSNVLHNTFKCDKWRPLQLAACRAACEGKVWLRRRVKGGVPGPGSAQVTCATAPHDRGLWKSLPQVIAHPNPIDGTVSVSSSCDPFLALDPVSGLQDIILNMCTGAGKSLAFQLPALIGEALPMARGGRVRVRVGVRARARVMVGRR